MVCKQLGFTGAQTVHNESFYGSVSSDFSYDDISCNGGEGTLDNCAHANVENCGPNEGAGVVCFSGEVTSTTEKYPDGKYLSHLSYSRRLFHCEESETMIIGQIVDSHIRSAFKGSLQNLEDKTRAT